MKFKTKKNIEKRVENFLSNIKESYIIGVRENTEYDVKEKRHYLDSYELRYYEPFQEYFDRSEFLIEVVEMAGFLYYFPYGYTDESTHIEKKEAINIIVDYISNKIDEMEKIKAEYKKFKKGV